MIEIHNVSKSFGNQHVLKKVAAQFHPGKVNFIIGRSGSGKSAGYKLQASGTQCVVSCYPLAPPPLPPLSGRLGLGSVGRFRVGE